MKKERILSLIMLLFLLGVRDGYITLWKDGKSDPIRQFPYRVQYLPASDQRALVKGICVENPNQLAQLLEDYLS